MLNRDFIKYAKEIDWAFPTPIERAIFSRYSTAVWRGE